MARLDHKLAALETLSPAQLRAEWERVHEGPAPQLAPDLLRMGIAYRLQEKRHGGLPIALMRELQRIAKGEQVTARPAAPDLRPGTQLIRQWQGRTILVTVEEDGRFLFDGEQYASLSAVARTVTGAHWSGPRFFGIKAHA